MMRAHAEQRSLVAWLMTQERVIKLWIEETLAAPPSSPEFLERLEAHHSWLRAQIDDLTERRAA